MRLPIEEEAERLRAWLADPRPAEGSAEAERDADDYPAWERVYAAVNGLLRVPPPAWNAEQCAALVYVVGRDHLAMQVIDIVTSDQEAFLTFAGAAARSEDDDAKWQAAAYLPTFPDAPGIESMLLGLVGDGDEYVERRALLALAELGSAHTERLAVEHWRAHESDDEHARIGALAALEQIGSRLCDEYVRLALADGRPYLCRYAEEMRLRRDQGAATWLKTSTSSA